MSKNSYQCYLCNSHALPISRNVEFGWAIYKCTSCGLLQTENPSEEFLSDYYQTSFSDNRGSYISDGYIKFANARGENQRKYIEQKSNRADFAKVLDFGAGAGCALAAYDTAQKFAFDPDPNMRRFLSQEEDIQFVDKQSLFSGEFDGAFDLIILSHVLEHFASPLEELHALRRILKSDGFMFIEVPVESERALSFIQKTLKADSGHLFHFSPKTLRAMLDAAPGYDVCDVTVCGPPMEDSYLSRVPLSFDYDENEDGVWLRAVLSADEPVNDYSKARATPSVETQLNQLRVFQQKETENVRIARSAYEVLTRGDTDAAPALDVIGLDTNYCQTLSDAASRSLQRHRRIEDKLAKERDLASRRLNTVNEKISILTKKYKDFAQKKLPHYAEIEDGFYGLDSIFSAFKNQVIEDAGTLDIAKRRVYTTNLKAEEIQKKADEQKHQAQQFQKHANELAAKLKNAQRKNQQLQRDKTALANSVDAVRRSLSFRLGAIMTSPLRLTKRLVRKTRPAPQPNPAPPPNIVIAPPAPATPAPTPAAARVTSVKKAPEKRVIKKNIPPLEDPSSSAFYREYGFAVFRGVLPTEECAQAATQFKSDLVGDGPTDDHTTLNLAALYPPGERYALDERLLSPVRQCIGPDTRFLQWSSYQLNYLSLPWHRDGPYREFGVGNDWDENDAPYKVAKIIAYLDCKDFALAVYPKSHKTDIDRTLIKKARSDFREIRTDQDQITDDISGAPCLVHVRQGDAIVFDLRIIHCGRLLDKDNNGFSRNFSGDKAFLTYLYGADNPHSYRTYSYFAKERGYNLNPMHKRLVERLRQKDMLLSIEQQNYFDLEPGQRANLWLPGTE